MKNQLILPLLCFVNILFAQSPEFMMPIWFEDAVGNKDTLWVGFDLDASSSEINAQFGEEAITTPYDSVFEVRAAHGFDSIWSGLDLSKVIIEGTDNPSLCCLFPGTQILIHATNFPIKISWDSSHFLSDEVICAPNTVLSYTDYIFLLQDWFDIATFLPGSLFCMSGTDHIYMNEEDRGFLSDPHALSYEHPIEGLGVDTVWGFYLSTFFDAPHCLTTLPVEEIEEITLTLYPNPCTHFLNIENLDHSFDQFQIFDIESRIVKEGLFQNELAIADLEQGIYLIVLKNSKGQMVTETFVKM